MRNVGYVCEMIRALQFDIDVDIFVFKMFGEGVY